MKSSVRFTLRFLVLVAVLLAIMPFWKGEMEVRSEESSRPVPQIDLQHDVPFETATFSLG